MTAMAGEIILIIRTRRVRRGVVVTVQSNAGNVLGTISHSKPEVAARSFMGILYHIFGKGAVFEAVPVRIGDPLNVKFASEVARLSRENYAIMM